MSIEALSVVLNHSQAPATAKLVLLGIANHYHPDDDRGAWPSQERLARYSNVSDRQVRNLIDQLVELGELQVEAHAGRSQTRNKPNRYWITLECPEECDRSMNHRPRPETPYPTTGNVVPDDRKFSAPRPEPHFQGTVIEPEKNQNRTVSSSNRPYRLPEDWYPSQRLLDMFPEKWPSLDPEYEIENFINYWLGEGKPKADWDRTFQGWMSRNQKQAKPGGYRGFVKPTAAERTAQLIHGARAKDEQDLITKGIGAGPDFGHMLKGVDS